MSQADPVQQSAPLPVPGEDVDRYRVLGEIAAGGMAVVFAAQRESLAGFERLVALKVIHPHLAADRYFVDMFLDEARIASKIHHANVVQVFDVVEHRGLPCIVMELLRGRSLASVLQHSELVRMPLRLHIVARAAEGLHAAHTTAGGDGQPLGIVHRDVSPDNIHVGYDGHIKLVDFGIAAARGRVSSTRTGELKGKLAYLSPEQITSAPDIDAKVDVWGLAVLAWEALTGERLFVGDADAATMWNVVHRSVPSLAERVPALCPNAAEAIMAGLSRDAAARITMPELAAALSGAAIAGGATSSELASLMQDAFADEQREAQVKLQRTLCGPTARGALTASTERPQTLESDGTADPQPRSSAARRQWSLIASAVVGTALVTVLGTRLFGAEAEPTKTAPAAAALGPADGPDDPAPVAATPSANDSLPELAAASSQSPVGPANSASSSSPSPSPPPLPSPAAGAAQPSQKPEAPAPTSGKRRRRSSSAAKKKGRSVLLDSPY